MQIAKWVAAIAGGLLALAVLAILVLTLLIDPNRFKGRIEAAVRDATGRSFDIVGDLDIGWFPWLSLRTGAARLGNPPNVPGAPLAQWESASVGAKLIPLLRGELVIDRVWLSGLEVNLHRGADGQANWEDLLASRGGSGADRESSLRVAGLQIRDGTLSYIDERSGTRAKLSSWTLDVGAWEAGREVPMRTSFVADSTMGASSLGGAAEVSTRARVSEDASTVSLGDTRVKAQVRGRSFPGAGVPLLFMAPRMTVGLKPMAIGLPAYALRVADASVKGSIEASEEIAAPRMPEGGEVNAGSGAGDAKRFQAQGGLSMHAPSLRKLLRDLGVEASLPTDPAAMGLVSFTGRWAYSDSGIAVRPLTLQLDETKLTGELHRSAAAEPTWTLKLHGDRIDIRRYTSLEEKTDEPSEPPLELLKALRVQGELSFDEARLADAQMKKLRLRLELDESTAQ